MICAACGTENAASKRFCRGCGASLAAACPACGAAVRADDRFCGECGTPLGPATRAPADAVPAAPAPLEPSTERRLVGSVDVQERACFAAASGSLAVAEGRYDEALRWAEAAVAAQGLLGTWPQNVKQGLVAAVDAALVLGLTDKVEEFLSRIEGQPAGMRTPLMAAHANRYRGRLAGSAAAAESAFAAAERLLRDLGIPFWLAVTQLEHAEALHAHGGAGDVRALLDPARETFAQLRATPWVERVDAVGAPVAS